MHQANCIQEEYSQQLLERQTAEINLSPCVLPAYKRRVDTGGDDRSICPPMPLAMLVETEAF